MTMTDPSKCECKSIKEVDERVSFLAAQPDSFYADQDGPFDRPDATALNQTAAIARWLFAHGCESIDVSVDVNGGTGVFADFRGHPYWVHFRGEGKPPVVINCDRTSEPVDDGIGRAVRESAETQGH